MAYRFVMTPEKTQGDTLIEVLLRTLPGGCMQFYVRNPANGLEWIYAQVYPDGKVEVYNANDGFRRSTSLDTAVSTG